MIFQFDIILSELLLDELHCDKFAQRLSKAKSLSNYSQKSLSEATGVSLSTISNLEAGYRDTLTRDTLIKLLSVLDKNILCDDYCNFILNQENEIKKLLHLYGMSKLSKLLNIHRSTIERWRNGKYQVSRKQYSLISKIKGHEI